MNKKGDFGMDEISKLIIALIVLFTLLAITWLLRDKLLSLFDKLVNILRFH